MKKSVLFLIPLLFLFTGCVKQTELTNIYIENWCPWDIMVKLEGNGFRNNTSRVMYSESRWFIENIKKDVDYTITIKSKKQEDTGDVETTTTFRITDKYYFAIFYNRNEQYYYLSEYN